ncbi:MAG: S8 family serine peptidase [Planctomycetota bacterium]
MVYTIDADPVIPDDEHFDSLWGLHNTGQSGGTDDADIDAPEAWAQTTGSDSVLAAVIDTGIDYTHPDLAANIWTNPGKIPDNGIDDDDNGYVDDVHGYDFFNGHPPSTVGR